MSNEGLRGPRFAAELRRAYIQYCAEHGRPDTWVMRSEVFEDLIATILEGHGFTQEDVITLEEWSRPMAESRNVLAQIEAQHIREIAARIFALLPPETR